MFFYAPNYEEVESGGGGGGGGGEGLIGLALSVRPLRFYEFVKLENGLCWELEIHILDMSTKNKRTRIFFYRTEYDKSYAPF